MHSFTSAGESGTCGSVDAMTVTSFEGKNPDIGEGCWIHPSAEVIGDVRLGARCWIGPGARLRGDYGAIVLGDCCAVEDNCVVHARPGETCTIGAWVTLGHGCVVHNVALLGDYAVVGMGAVVPAARIAAGVPVRLLERAVDDEYRAAWLGFKQIYVDLCERYREGFGR